MTVVIRDARRLVLAVGLSCMVGLSGCASFVRQTTPDTIVKAEQTALKDLSRIVKVSRAGVKALDAYVSMSAVLRDGGGLTEDQFQAGLSVSERINDQLRIVFQRGADLSVSNISRYAFVIAAFSQAVTVCDQAMKDADKGTGIFTGLSSPTRLVLRMALALVKASLTAEGA